MLFQTAIISETELFNNDLPENTFALRFKKAKMLKGLTQDQLAKATGLNRGTISELEAGYRENITRETLVKLLSVLDKDLICDDYLNFILNQEEHIKTLINSYGLTSLCTLLHVHRSTIERWRDGKYQIKREMYNKIIKLK